MLTLVPKDRTRESTRVIPNPLPESSPEIRMLMEKRDSLLNEAGELQQEIARLVRNFNV